MDLLRGVAIPLVMLHHIGSIMTSRGFDAPSALAAFNDLMAPFRMPALMFLSGLLLAVSFRKPLGTYLDGKIRRIAYPAALWTVVFALTIGVDWAWWHPRFWFGSTYLWFLQTVFAYYLLALLVRRLPMWIPVLVPAALALATESSSILVHRFVYLMGFFFLGYALSQRPDLLRRVTDSRWTWVFALPAGLLAVLSLTGGPYRYSAAFAPLVVAGIFVAVRAARALQTARWTGPVQYVGRQSLIFYVLHYPLIVLLVDLLLRRVDLPPALAAPSIFALLVAAGFAVSRAARRTPLLALFEMPRLPDVRARWRPRPAPEAAPVG